MEITEIKTMYRTDEPYADENFWKEFTHIWIEELDENQEGDENYLQISKDKYFELCKNGQIVDAGELRLFP